MAEFLCQTIERSGTFDIQLVSLSSGARDDIGVALTHPWSWLRGVRLRKEFWRGRGFTRVGAFASELEFQRYQPRPVLTELLAGMDLIQVVSGSPAWALAVCGLGTPVAVHCATRAIVERRRRDSMARGLKATWRRWMTYFTDRLERKALSMVDAIQVMNPWMLDYARQVNAERSTLIRYAPPGVDAELFRPTLNRDLRRDAYVLTVGRLDDPRKNIELVLNAYASLPDELQRSTRLVLAGSADPGSTFWKRVKDLMLGQRVEFIRSPDRETLVRLYQSAAVFALGSDEEGFGMVILEAMACGVPVVSTRSGGPQGIIADGHDGFLVPLADPNAMGDRLACLLSDEALNRRMGEAARETVMQKYEAGVAGDAFLRVYDELLSRDRSRAAVTL